MRSCIPAEVQDEVILSYPKALKDFLVFSLPYVFARMAIALPGFFDGLILEKLGPDAVLAGPIISTVAGAILGISGSAVGVPTGYLAGKLAAEGEKLLAEAHRLTQENKEAESNEYLEKAEKCFKEVGRISRQALLQAIPLAVASGLVLFFIRPIVKGIQPSISDEVSNEIQSFFRYYALSIFPSLIMSSDKQLAMALNKPNVAAISSVSHAALTSAIAYPLAFTSLGIQGPGIGVSISAFLNSIALRFYLSRADFKKYRINYFFDGFREKFCRFFKESLTMGFFTATELANIAVIIFYAVRMGPQILSATQPSLQLIVPSSFALFAFAQSSGVYLSRIMGKRQSAIDLNDEHKRLICEKNISKTGNINLILAVFLGLLIGGMTAIFAKSFSSLFTSPTTEAVNLLLINCLGILFDAIRILGSGNLRAFQDTRFSAMVSVLFMSVMGLSVSAGTVFGTENPSYFWLFAPRVVGLAVSSGLISARWFRKSSEKTFQEELEHKREAQRLLVSSSVNSNNIDILSDSSDIEAALAQDKSEPKRNTCCCIM